WTGERAHWGEADEPAGETIDAGLHEYRLAGIMAAGAQVNLVPFHGGTNFGFHAGRDVAAPAAFVTTSHDCDAPLGEAGGRGEKYFATRRLCTFASQFSHVFAQLDADHHTATIAPDEGEHPVAVLHQRGQQGDVIFLIRSE